MDRPSRELDVQTLRNPLSYTPAQIRIAFTIAYRLDRGKLVVCAEPEGEDVCEEPHEHA